MVGVAKLFRLSQPTSLPQPHPQPRPCLGVAAIAIGLLGCRRSLQKLLPLTEELLCCDPLLMRTGVAPSDRIAQ
jgi:hypothetical protein